MGDYVGNDKITTNIQGDGNQNVVRSAVSNSFNMNLVYQRADALKEVIDKEYKGVEKQVLVGQVEEIMTLAAEKKNSPTVRELLGGIMTKTAEFATIGTVSFSNCSRWEFKWHKTNIKYLMGIMNIPLS